METARLRIRPSIRVLEKIGMQPAGRRQAYGHEHVLYRADNPEVR
jgi:RimJ/RimL family protein N-acetyltransferase